VAPFPFQSSESAQLTIGGLQRSFPANPNLRDSLLSLFGKFSGLIQNRGFESSRPVQLGLIPMCGQTEQY